MAYEHKPGSGALFPNWNRTSDSQPNATGVVVAHRDIREGERLRLAAWTREGDRGRWQSIKMSDDRSQERRREAPREEPQDDPFDDSIPW